MPVSISGGPPRVADPPAGFEGLTPFEADCVAVLLATAPGDVLAYGEVAAEAGHPGAARAVGSLLRRVDGLPWWRVVTASGRLVPHAADAQRELLVGEGVTVDGNRVVATPGPSSDQYE